jgi:UDP-GlcNAc:undecaprenyl-phosphate GlcNAc-1-phosphate transferase
MFLIICSFFTAFLITFMAIPSIIRIAEIKHLFDVPDERKSHTTNVPTLGGLAIFAGLIFSLTFWASQKEIVELQYIIAAIMILFFMGMKDDLFDLVAYKKLAGQLMASFILVHWANINITSFYGIFGIDAISTIPIYLFSMFTIVVITNSFNLIDGIDGLAGMIGALAATTFGIWYYCVGMTQYVVLSASLVGSLLAFLYYNKTPAKIFMGDTGSLIVGVVLSILAIKFIETNRHMGIDDEFKVRVVPVMTIGILIIPLFDTLRVFMMRILQGRSPFSSDRNHIHHLLLDIGLTHFQAVLALSLFNVAVIVIVFFCQKIRGEITLAGLLGLCFLLSSLLASAASKRKRKMIHILPKKNLKEKTSHKIKL